MPIWNCCSAAICSRSLFRLSSKTTVLPIIYSAYYLEKCTHGWRSLPTVRSKVVLLSNSCTQQQFCKCVWSQRRLEMFKNTFQSGFLSILYSIGSKPLQIWDKNVSFVLLCLASMFECEMHLPPGQEWPHKEDHWQWYPVSCVGDCWYQCQVNVQMQFGDVIQDLFLDPYFHMQHHIHHVSCWSEKDSGNQTTIFGDDH